MHDPTTQVVPRRPAWLAALGAIYAAAAIALAAYASHAADAGQEHLLLAAAMAFGHGVALAALSPGASGGFVRVALAAMAVGTLLFCGSLAGKALWGWPATLAPFGGSLLIAAWLALAMAQLRR
jgi:uncharacterized membrane protein YgdD (TMEM256/DUF423 family)